MELARPTAYGTTGIYADWNVDVDIGNGNTPLAAAFRGNGKTISHLYISRSTGADASETGLFGALGSSSSVTNPGLPDASVAPTAADRLAGNRAAPVSMTYAQGSVSASGANAVAGGLEGRDSGTITAAYAIAGVSGGSSAKVGGLGGENRNRITATYAAGGAVSGGSSARASAGGLVGVNAGSGRVSNGYWDREASGQTRSSKTAAAGLKSPADYTGIYSGWNINLDADATDDNPWNFGLANQYPVLRFGGHDAAAQFAAQPDRAPSFGTANASAQNYLAGVTVSETLPALVRPAGTGRPPTRSPVRGRGRR